MRKGWGYGFIIEDNQGKQLGEVLFKREAFTDLASAFNGGLKDIRGRAFCNLTVNEDGFRVDLMPRDAIQPNTAVKDVVIAKKRGRPKGAKNKNTKKVKASEVWGNEVKSQEIMNESIADAQV
jgi:hypothetical protein